MRFCVEACIVISQTALRMNSSQQVALESTLFCAYTEDCSLCIYRGLHTIVKKKDLIGFTKVHDTHARKYGYVVLLLALLSWLPVSAECCQTVFHQLVMEGGWCGWFRYSVALRPQKPPVGLGTGSPGRPRRLSHNSQDGLHPQTP